MEKVDYGTMAGSFFAEGYNCAQSVLMAYAGEIGMSREVLGKMVSGLGGGMGGTGHTCGAVSGAVVALSVLLGGLSLHENERNQLARAAVGKFIIDFETRYGHLNCSGLIGVDVRNEQARDEARAVGAYRLTCSKVVHGAAELVEETVARIRKGA